MNKIRLTYFEKENILHLAISDEPESGSIEILNASVFLHACPIGAGCRAQEYWILGLVGL